MKKENISTYVIPEPVKNRATLEAGILAQMAEARFGAVPLKHVVLRFSAQARRIGIDITQVLNEMSKAGKIGLYRFERLNRTFVFDGSYWDDVMNDYRGESPDIFDKLENTFRNEK